MAIAAIFSVFVISIYALKPAATDPGSRLVPNAAATPRKVKPIATGDINGDGRDLRTRSSPARTETVDNNESLRPNTTVNAAKAQDGSGTDNANRRPKTRASAAAPAPTSQPRSIKKKNQDIEVENDETHRTLPATAGAGLTANSISNNAAGTPKGKTAHGRARRLKTSIKKPRATTQRPRDGGDNSTDHRTQKTRPTNPK